MINFKGNYYTSSKTHPVHLVFPIACFPTFYFVDRCWKAIKIKAILVTRQIDGFVKVHMLLCIHNSNNTGVYNSADDHHLMVIVANKAFSSYQKLGLGTCREIRKLYLLVAGKDHRIYMHLMSSRFFLSSNSWCDSAYPTCYNVDVSSNTWWILSDGLFFICFNLTPCFGNRVIIEWLFISQKAGNEDVKKGIRYIW